MAGTNVDFKTIYAAVDRCCKTVSECGECTNLKCLIGFARQVANYGLEKNVVRIPDGEKLIPKDDARVYYQEDLLSALVETLRQCKNCRENHEPSCGVSLIRSALELALVGEIIEYKGNVVSYLVDLGNAKPEIGRLVMARYRS